MRFCAVSWGPFIFVIFECLVVTPALNLHFPWWLTKLNVFTNGVFVCFFLFSQEQFRSSHWKAAAHVFIKNLICVRALLIRAGLCACACVWREQKSMFGVFLYSSPSYLLGQDLSLIPELTDWLTWLASVPPGSCCLRLTAPANSNQPCAQSAILPILHRTCPQW